MEPTVYKYIIRYSMRQQVVLIALAGLSFPFLYFFYELPKMILNGAISGKAEDRAAVLGRLCTEALPGWAGVDP